MTATSESLRWAYYAAAIEVNTTYVGVKIDALILWQKLTRMLR